MVVTKETYWVVSNLLWHSLIVCTYCVWRSCWWQEKVSRVRKVCEQDISLQHHVMLTCTNNRRPLQTIYRMLKPGNVELLQCSGCYKTQRCRNAFLRQSSPPPKHTVLHSKSREILFAFAPIPSPFLVVTRPTPNIALDEAINIHPIFLTAMSILNCRVNLLNSTNGSSWPNSTQIMRRVLQKNY